MNKVWTLLGSFGFFSCLGWSSSQQAMEDLLSSAVRAPRPDGARLLKRAHLSNQDDTAGSEDLLAGQRKEKEHVFPESMLNQFKTEEKRYISQAEKSHDRVDYYLAINCERFLMAGSFLVSNLIEEIEAIETSYRDNKKEYDEKIANLVLLIGDKQVAHDWALKICRHYASMPDWNKIELWNAIVRAFKQKESSE